MLRTVERSLRLNKVRRPGYGPYGAPVAHASKTDSDPAELVVFVALTPLTTTRQHRFNVTAMAWARGWHRPSRPAVQDSFESLPVADRLTRYHGLCLGGLEQWITGRQAARMPSEA